MSEHTLRGIFSQMPSKGAALPVHQAHDPASDDHERSESLRVLICIDRGLNTIQLYQEQLQAITNDESLFEFLRAKYIKHRKFRSWFTFRGLKRVALAKFSIDANSFPDVSIHEQHCFRQSDCTCLPPISRVGKDKEYNCTPAPAQPPKTLPALTSRRLTHYFLRPHSSPSRPQSWIFNQLPKWSGATLEAISGELKDGWGLHFEEDWHWPSIALVCALLIQVSLVFGTAWAIVKGDVQSGFAVSAIILAIPPVPLALILVQDSK